MVTLPADSEFTAIAAMSCNLSHAVPELASYQCVLRFCIVCENRLLQKYLLSIVPLRHNQRDPVCGKIETKG